MTTKAGERRKTPKEIAAEVLRIMRRKKNIDAQMLKVMKEIAERVKNGETWLAK
jgi:hypothetical protein